MKRTAEVLSGLLGGSKKEPARAVHRLEDIRLAMLDMLGGQGEQLFPLVVRRIRAGGDAQALWYARADLMAALASMHGERVARTRMVSLSVLFDGMLPKGMMSSLSTMQHS